MKLQTQLTLEAIVWLVLVLMTVAILAAGCAHRAPAPLAIVPCDRSVQVWVATAFARIEDAPPGCWDILERDSTVRRVVKP